jgi:hypothetical protein
MPTGPSQQQQQQRSGTWNVPRIVARRALRLRLARSSWSLIMTSVRLQNWYGRRMISLRSGVVRTEQQKKHQQAGRHPSRMHKLNVCK